MFTMFSSWHKWVKRNELKDIKYPGVYVLVYSEKDISNLPFDWIPNIVYIGMTNSIGGLKSRLQQFENTIKGKKGHGGAHRFRFKHKDYNELVNRLYVSVKSFKCDVNSIDKKNLLLMGKVAEFEYVCFAEYVEKYGHLPEFNDKKLSPKR